MKIKSTLLTIAISMMLAACGGGGGGGGTPSAGTGGNNNTATATNTNPVDPVSRQPTTGVLTNSVTGTVYGAPTTGAVVTAYNVQPDGSNGALLGTSAPTGADGKFSIALNSVPAGMVRLVATGGSYTSEADNTRQPVTTLELVTPYVTTDLNTFAITPITHIASHVIAYESSRGATLVNAYFDAMVNVLQLSGNDVVLKGDARQIVNLLKTIPNSSADTLHAYQDLITALEWFGVAYDLPSSVVFRIAAANAEGGFPLNGVDGTGTEINVGAWVGGAFDSTSIRTMNTMMQIPSAGGVQFHENLKPYIGTNLIQDFYVDAACNSVAARQALYDHFPNMSDFFNQTTASGFCTAASTRVAALRTKANTNNRASMH